MQIIKVLYWLYGSFAFSQTINCNDGYYYCNEMEKCIIKGVICKKKCDECREHQRHSSSPVACINVCNNEVNHLTDNNDCFDYTRCKEGYEVIKENNICSCNLKELCDYNYVCPYSKEIKDNLMNGYTTYEISLVLKDEYKHGNIYAIYGDKENPMTIPPAYQIDQHVGVSVGGINPVLKNYAPESEYDSWLTIGIDNSEILGKISYIGIDFDKWDKDNGLTINNGAVFLLDPTLKLSKTNKYIIGHLTLKDTEDYKMIINAQGLQDTRLVLNGINYVETNILYNFKKKEINGH